jgi:glucokinase
MVVNQLVLAGDIGGTKTLLQLLELPEDGSKHFLFERRFESAAYADFSLIVKEFLRSAECMPAATAPISAACFGVAGPIRGEVASITNLGWVIDGGALSAEFGIPRVSLINDFAAVGYGIAALKPEDVVTLQAGEAVPQGVRAVLGAGTGLGEGFLVWQAGRYIALPSEGGHVDFAPTDLAQVNLMRYLQARNGHVSYERILSGSGLVTLLDYVQESGLAAVTPALQQAMTTTDPAAAISEFGLDGRDPAAVYALDLFVAIYGAQAGNLALTLLPRGGLYVAGGIAPKIIQRLQRGSFMQAFNDKGRFESLLRTIPVQVVMNPKVGLMGAVEVAMALLPDNNISVQCNT